jgi:hypothetical protein
MSKDDYDPLKCPMPDCGADLYLTWTASIGLARGVVTSPDESWLPDPHRPDGADWKVDCADGHVVLLPGPTGCPCGVDDCAHEGFDTADDMRNFHPLDAERLSATLIQLGAAVIR